MMVGATAGAGRAAVEIGVSAEASPASVRATSAGDALQAHDVNALWARYAASHEREVRDALVVQYTPLVKYVVGRLAISLPAVIDFEDVLSYGLIGLLDAIERFDPSRGIKFENYAIPRIRGSIIDALRSLDPLSRTARDRAREVERARSHLETQLRRSPTDEELAANLGLSLARYHQQRAASSVTVLSLDSMFEVDSELAAHRRSDSFVDNDSPSPPDVVEQRELLQRLATAISRLPERERLVLSLYYNDELTMKEVSRVLEVSESRVCQLHSQAISRLTAYLQERGL